MTSPTSATATDRAALPTRARTRLASGAGVSIALAVASVATSAGAAHADEPYVVRQGDTVSQIALRSGVSVGAIARASALADASRIRIGQVLTIPTTGTTTATLVSNTFAGRTYSDLVVAAANANKATLLRIGVPTTSQMRATIVTTATSMGVDPALALAIAYQESGFNHTAVSAANAIGTMQVIPSSGEWASQMVGRPLNLLDPNDNVVAGVAILRSLVRTSPDLATAIAGYYQGAASVQRNGMYPDTRRYVASVQTLMSRFR
ncbi:membrane-bound lytic murein transglycosylase C [mine drainage metagenome]|uniref:Membrane-bound lytic murein transglycosylase C n=1 Tax=mine drainage metagenome TaxID=410659 RepID=A0A1J5RLI1_9ZZZZ